MESRKHYRRSSAKMVQTTTTTEERRGFEPKCYRKLLGTPCSRKEKNADMMQGLNGGENWLMHGVMASKVKIIWSC